MNNKDLGIAIQTLVDGLFPEVEYTTWEFRRTLKTIHFTMCPDRVMVKANITIYREVSR
jgi:hypothetical protein